jgi:cold shock CspA family protein
VCGSGERVMEGTITAVRTDRFFGFISPDGGSKAVFFHGSVLDDLELNEQLVERRVRYEAISTALGPKAIRVWAAD